VIALFFRQGLEYLLLALEESAILLYLFSVAFTASMAGMRKSAISSLLDSEAPRTRSRITPFFSSQGCPFF